jgi:hypothetical protein
VRENSSLIRNLDAIYYAEMFLVCAVSSILVIRLFLHLTGYPQIGNSTLHIAHMLWGGLLMLVAIIMLLSFIGRSIELWAAILGGVGFGTFIDEVGKFVTSDNDYFFEPSVSIMYIVFVLILLSVHTIKTGWSFTKREYLLNAIKGLEEVALKNLDTEEKREVLEYLSKSDPDDPLTSALRKLVSDTKPVPVEEPGYYSRIKASFSGFYTRIAASTYFRLGITIFFIGKLILTLSYVTLVTVFMGFGREKLLNFRIFEYTANRLHGLTFVDMAQIFSSLLSGVFVLLGVYLLRKSRLSAYRMFERSVLVSILLTYVFIFYKEQFAALIGLTLNILILIGLRVMIRREERGL